MIRKIRLLGAGVCVALLAVAIMAGGSSAAKAKPQLNLKSKGVVVPSGTEVGGGWVGAIEIGEEETKSGTVFIYYGCETLKDGEMKLTTNSSTKADIATGKVGTPEEECGTFEATEEEAGAVKLAHSGKIGRLIRAHRGHRKSTHRKANIAEEVVTPIGGSLTGEEMTVKHKGALTLGAPLKFEEVTGALKCTYESKTKLKGLWPDEEFPNTADIESEFDFKLAKATSSKTGCVKTPEGFIEAWVGPDFEELEAELT